MKKIITVLFALSLAVVMTGCQDGEKNFFGIVKGVVIGDDYEAAGERVGYAGYMAYVIMKGDQKYDKYTSKMEKIYKMVDESGMFDTASINQTILEVAQVALTDKYGFVYSSLITEGIRVGGAVADRMFLKNVSEANITLYAKGIKAGVDKARESVPQSALDEAAAKAKAKADKEKAIKEAEAKGEVYVEEDEWAKPRYITCSPVKTCVYKFTDRTLSVQKRIAEELYKFGFLDMDEEPQDEYTVPKCENVLALIARCDDLSKFGVTRLNLWISDVKVDCKWKTDETGKEVLDKDGNKIADCSLVAIRFLFEEKNGTVREVACVACTQMTELDDIPFTTAK